MAPEVQAEIEALKAKAGELAAKQKDMLVQGVEDLAMEVSAAALRIVDSYVKASKTPFDDMAWMAVRGQAEEALKNLVGQIKK